jgi:hypothetical protein
MVFCVFIMIDMDGMPTTDATISIARRYVPHRFDVRSIPDDEPVTPFVTFYLNWCGALASGSLLRRSVYGSTRGWDESFVDGAEDTDMYLQIALASTGHRLPEPLLLYRRHAMQTSQDAVRMHRGQEQLFRKWRQMSHLNGPQLRVVRRARAFREGRYLPHSWLRSGSAHLQRGNLFEAAKSYGRAARQIARYLSPTGSA